MACIHLSLDLEGGGYFNRKVSGERATNSSKTRDNRDEDNLRKGEKGELKGEERMGGRSCGEEKITKVVRGRDISER